MADVPILQADDEAMVGSISFPPDWNERPWIERADLLFDWLTDLTETYNATVAEYGGRLGVKLAAKEADNTERPC